MSSDFRNFKEDNEKSSGNKRPLVDIISNNILPDSSNKRNRSSLTETKDEVINKLKSDIISLNDKHNQNTKYLSDKLTESNKKLSEIANKNELLECEIHDYPRKLALEILQCERNQLENVNLFNVSELVKYTQENHVKKEISIDGGAKDLVSLFQTIYEYIDAEKECQRQLNTKNLFIILSTKTIDPLLLFPYKNDCTLFSIPTIPISSESKIIRWKSLATLVHVLLQYTNPLVSWEYATLQAIGARFISPSKLIIDIIFTITPGGRSGRTLERTLEKAVNYSKAQGSNIFMDSYLVYVYDNCPMGSGYIYKPSQEIGKEVASKNKSICTICMGVHIFNYSFPGSENLQREVEFSPKYDNPLTDNNGGDLHVDCPTTLYLPRADNQDVNEGTESEVDSFLSEQEGYYGSRISMGYGYQQFRQFISASDTRATVPILGAVGDDAKFPSGDFTQCNLCRTKFDFNKRVCDKPSGGCGYSKSQYFKMWKFKNKQLVEEEKTSETIYKQQQLAYTVPLCKSKIYNVLKEGDSIKSIVKDNNDYIDESLSLNNNVNSFLSFDQKIKYNTKTEEDKVIVEMLYPFDYNPSKGVDIEEVIRLAAIRMKIREFVDNADVEKEWAEMCSDVGAANWDLYDKFRLTPPFGNLRYRPSVGHEYFSVNHIVMKLLWDLGFDILTKVYGFSNPRQISYFMLGTLSHKSYEFINICRDITTNHMIAEWIRSIHLLNQQDIYIFSVENFKSWMIDEEGKSDKHFSNIVFLINHIFPAYFCYTKGIRNNMHSVYNGGRKLLLPFYGPLGRTPYFKKIVRDIWELEYRVKPKFRIFRKTFFTFGTNNLENCQPINLLCEQGVVAMQQASVNDSSIGVAISAHLAEHSQPVRETLFVQSGKKVQRKYNRPRTPLEFTLTRKRAYEVFNESVSFKKVPLRNNISTLDEKVLLLTHSDLQSLYDFGIFSLKKYVETGFNVLPKRINLRTDSSEASGLKILNNENISEALIIQEDAEEVMEIAENDENN